MYVCMYVFMYLCACITHYSLEYLMCYEVVYEECVYVCNAAPLRTGSNGAYSLCKCMHAHMCTRVLVCVHACMYKHMHECTSMHTCMYLHINTHARTHRCMHVYNHMCMHDVCLYICVSAQHTHMYSVIIVHLCTMKLSQNSSDTKENTYIYIHAYIHTYTR
jgi:hypothetical protein